MSTQRLLYGTWPSPISPADLAGALRLGDVQWDSDGETLVWLESRGRTGVLMAQSGADGPRELTSDLNVRAGLFYGGGEFSVAQGSVYFVSGGRIYRQALNGGPARPITPAFGEVASPTISPDGRWLVYVSSYEGQDSLAIVDTAGQHWPQKLLVDSDFVMQACWHPDGGRIACITWNHPQMPWDGTELRLLHLDFSGEGLPQLRSVETVAGDHDTALFQPEFSPDGRSLSYVSDESGWWQIHLRDLDSGTVRQVTAAPAEHGTTAGLQGMRTYAWGSDGLYFLRSQNAFSSLWHDDLSGAAAQRIDALNDYSALSQITVSSQGDIALVGSAAKIPPRVLRLSSESEARIMRRSSTETWPQASMAQTEAIQWGGHDGETVHGLYSPPSSARFEGSGPPPLIVLVHGGPVGMSDAGFKPELHFFTSRGFAVLDVNYRGSSGYGRAYRTRIRGSWGIYDVEDCASGAQYLVDQGLADADKLVIMGGSAGGFTVYQSLIEKPGFYKAGISRYGVADMFALAAETFKFEAHYLDSLLGPLPEAADIYRARSPLFHAEKIQDPLALYQGTKDTVVPQSQSEALVASLRSRGLSPSYVVYEDEGHGWRKSDTIAHYYEHVYQFLLKNVIYT